MEKYHIVSTTTNKMGIFGVSRHQPRLIHPDDPGNSSRFAVSSGGDMGIAWGYMVLMGFHGDFYGDFSWD